MVSKEFTINNELGLHMRPASLLSQMAAKYQSNITVKYNGKDFNCKSVMLLMTALIKKGSEIELVCEGDDEAEALAALVTAVETGLGE